VITDDEVLLLFERADPARFADAPPVPDAAGYLDALRTRSINVQLIETDQPPTEPTTPTKRHRWPLIAAAAAAVVLVVAGALVLAGRDDDESELTTAPDPAAAEEVAQGFADAIAAYDADRALTYLDEDALARGAITGGGPSAWPWSATATTRSVTTPAEFRLAASWDEAVGFKHLITDCEQRDETASGVSVRCGFDYHIFWSDVLGLGPYGGNYWDLTVRDGEIVSGESYLEIGTNRESDQMWEPFSRWVSTAYPDDARTMYLDSGHHYGRNTEESIRLWGLRTREYVASRDAFIARADAICTAAHDRLNEELRAAGVEIDSELPAYREAAAGVLDETLVELRAIPAPEAFRAEFDGSYALVEQLAGDLRGTGAGQAATVEQIHQLRLGLYRCTFNLPRP
jgi:hypothetical protein